MINVASDRTLRPHKHVHVKQKINIARINCIGNQLSLIGGGPEIHGTRSVTVWCVETKNETYSSIVSEWL